MSITLAPVTPDFAAEIGDVDLSGPLDAETLAEIKAAFWKYAVLVFPEQSLQQEQQLAFARLFGELERSVSSSRPGATSRINIDLADISNVDESGGLLSEDSRRRRFGLGNRLWHSDTSFREVPALCSLLYAVTVAPIGGLTEFADCRAGYDALGEDTKRRIEGRVAEHAIMYSRARLGFDEFDAVDHDRLPPVPQVLVRTLPESGRKTLYVGSHAGRILGMGEQEGRVLIDELVAHTTRRQFVYSHRWRVGDLVMWDNRCTLHRGTDYDDRRWRRDMHRATVRDVANSCAQEGVALGA